MAQQTQSQHAGIPRVAWIWMGLILLTILVIVVLQPFLVTLTLGVIFGVALIPVQKGLSRRLHISRTFSSIIACTFFLSVILAPLAFISYKMTNYVQSHTELTQELTKFEQKAVGFAKKATEGLGITVNEKYISQVHAQVSTKAKAFLGQAAGDLVSNLPELLLQFIILALTTYLVLTNNRKISAKALELGGASRRCVNRLRHIMDSTCQDVVFSNIITGLVQSTLVTLGAIFFTEYDPVVIFVITFFVSFIPVLGAGPVAATLGLFELLNNNTSNGLWLLALTCVVGFSDNVVRAWMMTKNQEDSAFMNLLATLGGIYVWGLAGLFIGPLVMTLAMKGVPLLLQELGAKKVKEKNRRRIILPSESENSNFVTQPSIKAKDLYASAT